jgi:small GTP-binding protein
MDLLERKVIDMDEPQEYKIKVCLLGDGAVGKTSLIRKYVYDLFDDRYIRTFGSKTTKKVVELKNPADQSPVRMTLMISDVMGQTDVKNIQDAYLYGCKGAILVCDITRKETMQNLQSWVDKVRGVAGDVPFVMLANKADLALEAKFALNDVQTVADRQGAKAFLTSARTGDNVENAFSALAGKLLLLRL